MPKENAKKGGSAKKDTTGNKAVDKNGKNGKIKGKGKRMTGGGGTVGYTVKPIRGQYYNVVDSLDGLRCPPAPQHAGPSRAPSEPPCCLPACCMPR